MRIDNKNQVRRYISGRDIPRTSEARKLSNNDLKALIGHYTGIVATTSPLKKAISVVMGSLPGANIGAMLGAAGGSVLSDSNKVIDRTAMLGIGLGAFGGYLVVHKAMSMLDRPEATANKGLIEEAVRRGLDLSSVKTKLINQRDVVMTKTAFVGSEPVRHSIPWSKDKAIARSKDWANGGGKERAIARSKDWARSGGKDKAIARSKDWANAQGGTKTASYRRGYALGFENRRRG